MLRRLATLCLCACALFFTGCNSVNQLNERLIVNGIGVDIEDGAYVVTMHVFDALRSGDGTDTADELQVVSGRGRSVMDAMGAVTLQTGKEPLYSQNLVLILGEETAKKGINNVIDFFIRYYEARPSVGLFVAKDATAREILNCKHQDKLVTAKEIEALAESGEINAKQLKSDVLTVVGRLEEGTSDGCMVALSLQKNEEDSVIYVDGTGVMNGDRLVGYLDLEETQGALFINGDAQNGTLVVPMEGVGNLSFSLMGCRSKITASVEDGLPRFVAEIEADLNLYEINGNIQRKYDVESLHSIEAAADEIILKKCRDAMNASVFYRSDIFRLGRRLLQSEPEYFKTIEKDWANTFVQSKIDITVKTEIKREGQEINPL